MKVSFNFSDRVTRSEAEDYLRKFAKDLLVEDEILLDVVIDDETVLLY